MDSSDKINTTNENEKTSFNTKSNTGKDNNWKNEKRICILHFKEDNEDQIKTGFFCKIQENSDNTNKSKVLLTTSFEQNKSNESDIKFFYHNDKEGKSLNFKDIKYSDKNPDYSCFNIDDKDEINEFYEIKQENINNGSLAYYSGYRNESEIDVNKEGTILYNENNSEMYFKFQVDDDNKYNMVRIGGPILIENKVIGILNGFYEGQKGEKAHIVIPIKSIIKNIQNKKNYILWIIIMLLILLVFASVFCVLYFLKKNDKKTENEDKFINEILVWEKNYTENNYTDISEYKISETSQYRICVYGAKAEKGGKGCVQCAESNFEKGAIIQYRLGGKTSGGEGGKNCGWTPKNAPNGAGLSWANYSNYFFIVAGGGGGNSESGRQGGDCEQDGAGKYGGKGATKDKGGKGGKDNSPSGDGTQFKGGNGASKKGAGSLGQYCGGGGGDGYYGGGGGDWGDQLYDGAGGGGSNYCQNNDGISCGETLLNKYDYSSIKIYKKIREENR